MSDDFLKQRIEELENELNDLEKRSEMIKESLNAYRKVHELELKRTGEEIPKKYKGMKIKQAVLEVVKESGRALLTKEVFQKLKEGGAEIGGKESSQLPYVYTCLMRLKEEGKIKKIGKSKWSQ
jgi:predicted RNase H-like nuclease (RuvC/YqgF family)